MNLKRSSFLNRNKWLIKNFMNMKVFILIFVIVVLNCLYCYGMQVLIDSSIDGYISVLYGGYSFSGFDIIGLCNYLIVVLFPIFIICKHMEMLNETATIPYIIRFGGRRNFLNNFIKASLFFITVFFIIYSLISLTSIFLLNFDIYTIETMTKEVLLESLVLKFLEIVFVFHCVMIIYAKRKSAIESFLVIVGAYFITAKSFLIFTLNPFGLSSLSRWSGYENGFIKAFACFVVLIVVMHVVLRKYLSKEVI